MWNDDILTKTFHLQSLADSFPYIPPSGYDRYMTDKKLAKLHHSSHVPPWDRAMAVEAEESYDVIIIGGVPMGERPWKRETWAIAPADVFKVFVSNSTQTVGISVSKGKHILEQMDTFPRSQDMPQHPAMQSEVLKMDTWTLLELS